jgi:hypothetical protein
MKNILKIKLLLILSLALNIGCSDDDEQVIVKNSPIENFTAQSDIESITLSWDVPSEDVSSFIIRYEPGEESVILNDGTINQITIDELEGGTEYTFSIWWVDNNLDPSKIVTLTAIPEVSPLVTFVGDLVFGNQLELDNIQFTDDGALQRLIGNLVIVSDGTDDIIDLSVFENLIFVTGTVTISDNPILSNLDALSSLATVEGGIITIQNNRNLYSFCGLSGLEAPITETINGNSFNPTYTDIVGANCKAPDVIYDDPDNDRFNTQAEIDALPDGITHIAGELIVGLDASTNDITDLSKFSKLRRIEGRLIIQRSTLLTDLTGFRSLEFIGNTDSDELVIRQMDGLTTLDGLQALVQVGRRVGIRQNPVLETLEGINNLKIIGENKITIGDCGNAGNGNPLLTDYCALLTLIEEVGVDQLEQSGSCIDSFSSFNPSFQDVLNGNCKN